MRSSSALPSTSSHPSAPPPRLPSRTTENGQRRTENVLFPEDLTLLHRATGRILAIELTSGEQFFAEVVIVVDEPPTPDVFLLRVLREPDGAFSAANMTGESHLLADISRVAPIPGIPYPESAPE